MIKLNRQRERIGWMIDFGHVEWAKVYLMQLILISVSINILKLSSSQSLFRFKSLISSSVGYTSVIYVRDRSSKAIIFATVLTMRLVSSSLFSCLFWNQSPFTMEFAVSLFAALQFSWATKPFSQQNHSAFTLQQTNHSLGNQRFPIRVRLVAMCRGELSAVIAWLSKCLWSRGKW